MIRITEIKIVDTLGTRTANFAPGTVTRISGANGTGKSSILRALGYVFSGGLDPSVIRKGAEKSVIEFALSNGVRISKTTSLIKPRKGAASDGPPRYKAELEILDSDGTVINAPQSYIAELAESLAVDPSTLLRIDTTTVPGRRALVAELLRLVPISFDPNEIDQAASYRSCDEIPHGQPDTLALTESPTAPLDLDGLKKVVIQITEQRRRTGQIRDDTNGAVARLQKALPEPNESADPSVVLREAEDYRRAVEQAIAESKLDIERKKAASLADAKDKYSAAVLAAQKQLDAARTVIATTEREALAALEDESGPALQKAISDVVEWKGKVQAHQRAATLREEIAVQEETLRAAAWKYDQLSGVLERLEKLRLEKLDHLPVAGLVVEDGQAFLEGVEWPNVNLARRVEVVLQICTQRSGKLPLLIIDDCEHLDQETRAAIEQGLADAGFQVLEAVVSDGPLTIEVKQ